MNSDTPPFDRGQLAGYDPADPTGAAFSTSADNQFLGMEWDFPDLDFSTTTGAQAARSNRRVRCRAVRNTSGGALSPKRCVEFDSAGGTNYDYGNKVSSYAEVGDAGGITDEYASTIPINAIFWAVIEGPSKWRMDNSSTFAIGDHVVSEGTGGKAVSVTPSATPATLFAQIQGVTGRAMQAASVAADDDIIVDIVRYR